MDDSVSCLNCSAKFSSLVTYNKHFPCPSMPPTVVKVDLSEQESASSCETTESASWCETTESVASQISGPTAMTDMSNMVDIKREIKAEIPEETTGEDEHHSLKTVVSTGSRKYGSYSAEPEITPVVVSASRTQIEALKQLDNNVSPSSLTKELPFESVPIISTLNQKRSHPPNILPKPAVHSSIYTLPGWMITNAILTQMNLAENGKDSSVFGLQTANLSQPAINLQNLNSVPNQSVAVGVKLASTCAAVTSDANQAVDSNMAGAVSSLQKLSQAQPYRTGSFCQIQPQARTKSIMPVSQYTQLPSSNLQTLAFIPSSSTSGNTSIYPQSLTGIQNSVPRLLTGNTTSNIQSPAGVKNSVPHLQTGDTSAQIQSLAGVKHSVPHLLTGNTYAQIQSSAGVKNSVPHLLTGDTSSQIQSLTGIKPIYAVDNSVRNTVNLTSPLLPRSSIANKPLEKTQPEKDCFPVILNTFSLSQMEPSFETPDLSDAHTDGSPPHCVPCHSSNMENMHWFTGKTISLSKAEGLNSDLPEGTILRGSAVSQEQNNSQKKKCGSEKGNYADNLISRWRYNFATGVLKMPAGHELEKTLNKVSVMGNSKNGYSSSGARSRLESCVFKTPKEKSVGTIKCVKAHVTAGIEESNDLTCAQGTVFVGPLAKHQLEEVLKNYSLLEKYVIAPAGHTFLSTALVVPANSTIPAQSRVASQAHTTSSTKQIVLSKTDLSKAVPVQSGVSSQSHTTGSTNQIVLSKTDLSKVIPVQSGVSSQSHTTSSKNQIVLSKTDLPASSAVIAKSIVGSEAHTAISTNQIPIIISKTHLLNALLAQTRVASQAPATSPTNQIVLSKTDLLKACPAQCIVASQAHTTSSTNQIVLSKTDLFKAVPLQSRVASQAHTAISTNQIVLSKTDLLASSAIPVQSIAATQAYTAVPTNHIVSSKTDLSASSTIPAVSQAHTAVPTNHIVLSKTGLLASSAIPAQSIVATQAYTAVPINHTVLSKSQVPGSSAVTAQSVVTSQAYAPSPTLAIPNIRETMLKKPLMCDSQYVVTKSSSDRVTAYPVAVVSKNANTSSDKPLKTAENMINTTLDQMERNVNNVTKMPVENNPGIIYEISSDSSDEEEDLSTEKGSLTAELSINSPVDKGHMPEQSRQGSNSCNVEPENSVFDSLCNTSRGDVEPENSGLDSLFSTSRCNVEPENSGLDSLCSTSRCNVEPKNSGLDSCSSTIDDINHHNLIKLSFTGNIKLLKDALKRSTVQLERLDPSPEGIAAAVRRYISQGQDISESSEADTSDRNDEEYEPCLKKQRFSKQNPSKSVRNRSKLTETCKPFLKQWVPIEVTRDLVVRGKLLDKLVSEGSMKRGRKRRSNRIHSKPRLDYSEMERLPFKDLEEELSSSDSCSSTSVPEEGQKRHRRKNKKSQDSYKRFKPEDEEDSDDTGISIVMSEDNDNAAESATEIMSLEEYYYSSESESDMYESLSKADKSKLLRKRHNEITMFLVKHAGKFHSDEENCAHYCNICNKYKTNGIFHLSRHLNKHLSGQLKCSLCAYEAYNTQNLADHKKRNHLM